MAKLLSSTPRRRAFTLVEVMVVVSMVAVLSLVAVPLYTKDVVSAILSEGVSGAGVLRTDMRIYLSEHGTYAGASFNGASNNICVGSADLEGKYFAQGDYSLTGVTSSKYTIRVSSPSKSARTDLPAYSVDQDGSEHGPYFTGM